MEEAEGNDISIPSFVQRAVSRFLVCGIPEGGFIRLRCPDCQTERALAFSCKGRGLCPSCGARRMQDSVRNLVERILPESPIRQYVLSPPSEVVGLLASREEALGALSRIFVDEVSRDVRARVDIKSERLFTGSILFVQRFTKTLSCYPHFHLLVLDGGFTEAGDETPIFHEARAPQARALLELSANVRLRFTRWLGKRGFLSDTPEAKSDDAWWQAATRDPSLRLRDVSRKPSDGFEVNASVRVSARDRRGREQLVRYVARPPFAESQLEHLDDERIKLKLRSPTRGAKREIVVHPLVLLRRLAWLVPPPRHHQIRFFGVFAPAARLRQKVVPAGPVGVQGTCFGPRAFVPLEPVPYRARWARLLARTYGVDGHACPACAGRLVPRGAVLPPDAERWLRSRRISPLESTGPPEAQGVLPFIG